MKRHPSREPMLPLDFTQPIRGTQVAATVYAAILTLRRRGAAVYSIAERQHKVDGKIVSTSQLLAMAAGRAP